MFFTLRKGEHRPFAIVICMSIALKKSCEHQELKKSLLVYQMMNEKPRIFNKGRKLISWSRKMPKLDDVELKVKSNKRQQSRPLDQVLAIRWKC